jgi:hypothetical protein
MNIKSLQSIYEVFLLKNMQIIHDILYGTKGMSIIM